jgi:HSP20 family protein
MPRLATLQNGNLQRLNDAFAWDPFQEITGIRRVMNSLFDSALNPAEGANWHSPAIDLYEKDGRYVVEAAMPGLKRDDINIEIADNRLTLSAKRQENKTEESERYHYREVRRGAFSRSIAFPREIDAEKVEAEYKDGMLRVTVPTLEQPAAKKVAIKG